MFHKFTFLFRKMRTELKSYHYISFYSLNVYITIAFQSHQLLCFRVHFLLYFNSNWSLFARSFLHDDDEISAYIRETLQSTDSVPRFQEERV